MRDFDPVQEERFFALFADYFDLEQTSCRKCTNGEYTLARMTPLAELAGWPERQLRILHVAGTKGKGSTCYFLGALLHAAGLRAGVFTSPHLATVRERFQVDGKLIGYPELIAHGRRLEARIRQRGLKPSLFEIMTVLSLELFVAQRCPIAVLETGIGGLLDATNYVPTPECCAITSVSFDHMQLLGETIVEIAAQKAGIIKPGIPVVCGRQPYPEAEAVIRTRAAQVQAPCLAPVSATVLNDWPVSGWPPFLIDNFRIALQVCRTIGVVPRPDRFVKPELRARCECIHRDPLVILDAAHNADSAQNLVATLRTLYPNTAFTTVLGIVKGKDVKGIFSALRPFSQDFILTNPRSHKGSELAALQDLARESGVSYTSQPEIASRQDLPPGKNLLFTGSFFTALIGEMLFAKGRHDGDG